MPTRDLYAELDDFLTYLEAGRLSPHTQRAYQAAIAGFIELLGMDATVKDIKRRAVREWLSRFHLRQCEPATIRVRLVALKEFAKFLEAEGHGTFDWLFAMRAPKMRHKLPNVPSQERLRAVLSRKPRSAFPKRDRAIWELLYCGLRAQEVVDISLKDFREHGTVLLVHGKGNKERQVPLSQGAVAAVRAYLPVRQRVLAKMRATTEAFAFSVGPNPSTAGRITARQVWRIVHDIAQAKGLEDFHPHLLRHACGSHLHQSGVPLQDIADLLGHAKLATAAIYTQMGLDQRLLKAYRKAFEGSKVVARRSAGTGISAY